MQALDNPFIICKTDGRGDVFEERLKAAFVESWTIGKNNYWECVKKNSFITARRRTNEPQVFGFFDLYDKLEKVHPEKAPLIPTILLELIFASSKKYLEILKEAFNAGLVIRFVPKVGKNENDVYFSNWVAEGLKKSREHLEQQLKENRRNILRKRLAAYLTETPADLDENIDKIEAFIVSGEANNTRWKSTAIDPFSETLAMAGNYANISAMCSTAFSMAGFDPNSDEDRNDRNLYSALFEFLATYSSANKNIQLFNSVRRVDVHGVFNSRELKISTYHVPLDVDVKEENYFRGMFPVQPVFISDPNGNWKNVRDHAYCWFEKLKNELVELVRAKLANQEMKSLKQAINELIDNAIQPITDYYGGRDRVPRIAYRDFKPQRTNTVTCGDMTDADVIDNLSISNVLMDLPAMRSFGEKPLWAYKNILLKRGDFIEIIKKNPEHEAWRLDSVDDVRAVYKKYEIDMDKLRAFE